MELSYYPGCTLKGSARELDDSFRGVAQRLDIGLKELKDWTCCGASSAHLMDEYLETALPAADLMIAQDAGLDVVAPCAACHVRMKAAAQRLTRDGDLKGQFPFTGAIRILSGLEMLVQEGPFRLIKERVTKPLTGLRVAPYYGCLAVRPPEVVEPDNVENPMQMDRILEALGAEVVSWPYKTDCCGGSLSLTRTDLVLKLSRKLIDMAMLVEADVMVTFCPMCQANLDTRQADISEQTGRAYAMPVLYLTELMGLAFGHSDVGSWLRKHLVPAEQTLRSRGLL